MRSSIQILLTFILSIVLVILSITQIYAEEYIEPNAEIVDFYVSPEILLTNHHSKVTITIKNTGTTTDSFKVKLYVLKEGVIEHEVNFDFILSPDEIGIDSTHFIPSSIGAYRIRGEVWDIYESRLYDSEMIEKKVKSEVGPFDSLVDIITTYPYPGKDVIALMTVVNKGIEKVDVVVNYKIEGTNISGEYTTAPEPESESSKPIFLVAPSESDLYTLSTEVKYLDSVVASSFGKFFVTPEEYIPMLEINGVPPAVKVEQGDSESLSIAVDNIGDDSIHDLQIITKGIPLEWLKRWPSFIYEVEPNDSRVFIISLDVPDNAHVGEYPIEFIAAAKETSSQDSSNLVVLEESVEKIEEFEMKLSMYQFLGLFTGIVTIIIIMIVIIMFLFVRKHEKDEWMKLYEKWGRSEGNQQDENSFDD